MVASDSNTVSLPLASVQQDFSQSSDHSNINSLPNEQLDKLTTSVGGKDGQFDIRNHLDKLTPAKGKNRYECPECGGDNLTIDPPTGKYQCWNYGRDKKHLAEIREFLSPWAGKVKGNGKNYALPQRQSKPKLSPPKPAKIPDAPLKLARFPQPVQVVTNGNAKTEYPYGNDRVMIRIDKPDGDKICFPMTGKIKGKKEQWQPYRSEEVLELGKGRWVLGVEGEKCVEAARALGIVSWTMQASDWRENLDNPSQFPLLMAMQRFKQSEVAGIVYFPDNDETGFKKAKTVSIACAMSGMPCIILHPLQIDPDATHGWDIADWVGDSIPSADEIVSSVESSAEEIKNREAVSGDRNQNNNIKTDEDDKNWTPSQSGFNPDNGNFGGSGDKPKKLTQAYLSAILAEEYIDKLLWNVGDKRWFYYGKIHTGLWTPVSDEYVAKIVATRAKNLVGNTFNHSLISGTTALLKAELAVEEWIEKQGLIPLRDGVLDVATMKLENHAPGNKFLWQLPYKWADRISGCKIVTDWLDNATKGDKQISQLIRAFLKAAVMGRADLQKFLELVGPGGTGKSTLLRLATSLVGRENTAITSLKQLEGNRFETAAIYGKRLVLITDSERYGGEVSVLKALTGQDDIRRERKGIQQLNGFRFDGMVFIGANEPIQSSDYTSGLKRRRCTVPFVNQIPEHQRRDLEEEFAPYLSGVLDWVLAMPDSDMEALIRTTSITVPTLNKFANENLLDTNPIAAWIDDNLVIDTSAKTKVGLLGMDESFVLYPNYCKWCEGTGSKAVSIRRFADALLDVLTNQLKYTGIAKVRDMYGAHITGLVIRNNQVHINTPRPITGTQTMTDNMTSHDGFMTDNMTSQTRSHYESDGYDESNQLEGNFIYNKNANNIGDSNALDVLDTEKNISKGSENNSSYPSDSSSARVSSVIDSSCNPSYPSFKPGDKVQCKKNIPNIDKDWILTVNIWDESKSNLCCIKPDGYITTWLNPEELELYDSTDL